MKPLHPAYYTRQDLRNWLQVSESTIKRYEKTGALQATHVGPRIVRYRITDVEEFLKQRLRDNPPDEDQP